MNRKQPRAGAVNHVRRLGLLACAGVALACGAPLRAQTEALPDPFGGVIVRQLGNGLTVWYRRYPGAGTTSISLTIPSGTDRDPAGREELAHVVEHALFAAREGLTQEQIASAVLDRGGSYNGATSPDRTVLWVNVARDQSGFAMEWLHGLLAPRQWDEAVMPSVREAVALELGLAPRGVLGRVRDEFVLRHSLMPAGFWAREFGLEVPEYRRVDRYAVLQRISGSDVGAFYREHYVPARMLLVIGGDLDSAAVFRHVEATFGQLPAWPATPVTPGYRLKQGTTRRYFWNLRDDVALGLGFRMDSLSAADHVRLIFAQQLLERRLMRRLRWGSEQAVYGLRTTVVRRGGAMLLQLEARTTPAELGKARSVISDEIQRLRQGRYPAAEFAQDRAALERALRVNQATPAALRAWHAAAFYDPGLHRTPPPLATRFAALTPEELAGFARRALGPDRELLTIERPLPLGGTGAVLIIGVALSLGVAGARRLLLRPIPRKRLRYLTRIRPPLLLRTVGLAGLGISVLIAGRWLAAGAHLLAESTVVARESLLAQATFLLLVIATAAFLVATTLALVPHRVLVFEHELRIKYLGYRTTILASEQLLEVRLARFPDVWLSRQLWRTVPLALGWRHPALLIRTRGGPDWFIAVRDIPELAEAIAHLQPLAPELPAGGEARLVQPAG